MSVISLRLTLAVIGRQAKILYLLFLEVMIRMRIAVSKQWEALYCYHKDLKGGRPCGPGKAGADATSLSLRLRFLSPGRCLTVFSLCFLLLSVLLLGSSCVSGFLSMKVNGINSLMAPFGSPAVPGRRAPPR